MKRLVSTLNLSKEDWLRYRKCGITGTDAGAILDVNPYRSAYAGGDSQWVRKFV